MTELNEMLYTKLINFSNELDRHQLSSKQFFDASLLEMISNFFGYKCSCITIYDNNNYIGCITYNDQMEYLKRIYHTGFKKHDSISRYISQNYNNIAYSDHRVIKCTDVYDKESYPNSDYYKFLQSANLDYVAVAPIRNFRLCVYKERGENDFSSSEIEILNNIATILLNKYNAFDKLNVSNTAIRIGDQYLDSINIGFIILDTNFSLVNCNKTALNYLNYVFNKSNFSNVYWDITSIFDNPENIDNNNVITKIINDFKLTLSTYTEIDNLNFLNKYYYLTVEKHDDNAGEKESCTSGTDSLISTLSERELEITTAISNGLKYQEIADKLFISINTVRTHLKNIYKKLDINNQRSLIYLFNQYKSTADKDL